MSTHSPLGEGIHLLHFPHEHLTSVLRTLLNLLLSRGVTGRASCVFGEKPPPDSRGEGGGVLKVVVREDGREGEEGGRGAGAGVGRALLSSSMAF